MEDPVLAAILKQCIAEVEKHKQEQIGEFTGAYGQSALSTPKDAEDDPEIRLTIDVLDGLNALLEKVSDEETR